MKILITTNHFWPEDFRINDLALGLQAKGHSVSVLTAVPDYPSRDLFPDHGFFKRQREIYKGIEIFRAPLIPRGNGSGVRLALNYFSYALSACLLAPFFLLKKFDVVFVFDSSPVTVALPALVMKKISKAPMMLWIQDLWPETLSATGMVHSKFILNLVSKLVRFIYKGCDQILVQSEAFRPRVEALAPPQAVIKYFPNTAESIYKPVLIEDAAKELKMLPNGFRVMFAGNIGIAQDFATILASAVILKSEKDIHWVIIGDGSRRPWVEEEIKSRGLEKTVHLLGRHPMESMPRFFALADVLLVTLKKEPIFALTIPSKIQSYMACAKPIVAAADGEGSRIVDEAGAGITCSAESPQELADAVLAMYQLSEEKRSEMGRAGRIYFEAQFERDMLVDRLEEWMINLVDENSK